MSLLRAFTTALDGCLTLGEDGIDVLGVISELYSSNQSITTALDDVFLKRFVVRNLQAMRVYLEAGGGLAISRALIEEQESRSESILSTNVSALWVTLQNGTWAHHVVEAIRGELGIFIGLHMGLFSCLGESVSHLYNGPFYITLISSVRKSAEVLFSVWQRHFIEVQHWITQRVLEFLKDHPQRNNTIKFAEDEVGAICLKRLNSAANDVIRFAHSADSDTPPTQREFDFLWGQINAPLIDNKQIGARAMERFLKVFYSMVSSHVIEPVLEELTALMLFSVGNAAHALEGFCGLLPFVGASICATIMMATHTGDLYISRALLRTGREVVDTFFQAMIRQSKDLILWGNSTEAELLEGDGRLLDMRVNAIASHAEELKPILQIARVFASDIRSHVQRRVERCEETRVALATTVILTARSVPDIHADPAIVPNTGWDSSVYADMVKPRRWYRDLGEGKCLGNNTNFSVPTDFHMIEYNLQGHGRDCRSLCDKTNKCVAFSRTRSNCILYEGVGVRGGGASWGGSHCMKKEVQMCYDSPAWWKDSAGKTCYDYFYSEWCTVTGYYGLGWETDRGTFGDWSLDGHTAISACCCCGGGNLVPNQPPAPGWELSTQDHYRDMGNRRCSTVGGREPHYIYKANKASECLALCDSMHLCYGYSASAVNCYLWMEGNLQAMGPKWGASHCFRKKVLEVVYPMHPQGGPEMWVNNPAEGFTVPVVQFKIRMTLPAKEYGCGTYFRDGLVTALLSAVNMATGTQYSKKNIGFLEVLGCSVVLAESASPPPRREHHDQEAVPLANGGWARKEEIDVPVPSRQTIPSLGGRGERNRTVGNDATGNSAAGRNLRQSNTAADVEMGNKQEALGHVFLESGEKEVLVLMKVQDLSSGSELSTAVNSSTFAATFTQELRAATHVSVDPTTVQVRTPVIATQTIPGEIRPPLGHGPPPKNSALLHVLQGLQALTGEQACENHSLAEAKCLEIPCCKWVARENECFARFAYSSCLSVVTGEQACERRDYGQAHCLAIPCCKWVANEKACYAREHNKPCHSGEALPRPQILRDPTQPLGLQLAPVQSSKQRMLQSLTGEQACELHNLGQAQCLAIPCCKWVAHESYCVARVQSKPCLFEGRLPSPTVTQIRSPRGGQNTIGPSPGPRQSEYLQDFPFSHSLSSVPYTFPQEFPSAANIASTTGASVGSMGSSHMHLEYRTTSGATQIFKEKSAVRSRAGAARTAAGARAAAAADAAERKCEHGSCAAMTTTTAATKTLYKCVVFVPTSVRSGLSQDYCQISEISFLSNGREIGTLHAKGTASSPRSSSDDQHGPDRAVDGLTYTDWKDVVGKALKVHFFNATSLEAFRFATSGESANTDRDPAQWTVSGSTDCITYTRLHTQNTNYNTTLARQQYSIWFNFGTQDIIATFKQFQFKATKVRSASATAVQIAEISFKGENGLNMGRLDQKGATASNPGSAYANSLYSYEASNAIDGSSATKWKDPAKKPLQVSFKHLTKVKAYRFTTAPDNSSNDPVNWVLSGSSDGTIWTPLHTQSSDYQTPLGREMTTAWFPLSAVGFLFAHF